MLQRLGIPVVYADDLGRKLSETDRSVRRSMTRLLGPEAYRPDGKLNRTYVARKIFRRKELQRRVNRIVHPIVEREVLRCFRQWERKGYPVGIVEAALIFEAGFDRQLDLVVVIDAPAQIRMDRVRRRDGVSASDVRGRMRAQWSMQYKRERADIVIPNGGSVRSLRSAMKSLHLLLSLMAGAPQS